MGPWSMQTASCDNDFAEDMDWEASTEEERPIVDHVQEKANVSTFATEMDWTVSELGSLDVLAPCRPLSLPGKKRKRQSPPITLVLDLDETLVHSTFKKEHGDHADVRVPREKVTIHVQKRPHLKMFMERVAQLFEIVVFTAGTRSYANQVLNVLDPELRLIRHRLFRDSCICVGGIYVKDLRIFGHDLARVAIVENSPKAYGLQVANGIPIESWFEDRSDTALADLLPFLETLARADDVRPVIAKRLNQSSGKIVLASK